MHRKNAVVMNYQTSTTNKKIETEIKGIYHNMLQKSN
jgi:hypothetical protein